MARLEFAPPVSEKAAPISQGGFLMEGTALSAPKLFDQGIDGAMPSNVDYFFFAGFLAASSSNAACAAANRATGTRKGEQLT